MAARYRQISASMHDRRPSPRRLLPLVIAILLAAGCGRTSPQPKAGQPSLPRYWHGAIEGPQPEAWAEAWPRDWSLNVAASAQDAAKTEAAYEVPKLPPDTPAFDLTREPSAVARVDSLAAAPESVSVYGESAAAPTAAGVLFPPQPVAEESNPSAAHRSPSEVSKSAQGKATPATTVAEASQPALGFPSETSDQALADRGSSGRLHDKRDRKSASPRSGAAQQSPGSPTGAVVNERATTRIRRGFELAERGAYFAARQEFVDVLQMIASAKDQVYGSPRRTRALADGLRAFDEAADFSPAAVRASELQLSVIVASHQTPVAKSLGVDGMLPEQLAEAYVEYAGRQLGAAVAGEPTGSMALHALGKLHSRLGRVEPEQNPQAELRAFALQQAALLARPDNHYAAHEIGVLLAEGGHFAESGMMLRQVAQQAPDPVVFRNLARVETKLGRPDLAAASQRQAELLAARGNSPAGPVQWVPPTALARTPDPLAPSANPMMARGAAPVVR